MGAFRSFVVIICVFASTLLCSTCASTVHSNDVQMSKISVAYYGFEQSALALSGASFVTPASMARPNLPNFTPTPRGFSILRSTSLDSIKDLSYMPLVDVIRMHLKLTSRSSRLVADEAERFIANSMPDPHQTIYVAKPVIYLYPEEPCEVSVELDYKGTLDVTYPDYVGGWHVTAYPDGTLINHIDGREYSYLFWEGHSDTEFDMSHGFVVRGSETVTFLRDKLAYIGLTPREYNEFIVYWLPQMQKNAYNLIAFQGELYTTTAQLRVTPEPDSVLRVFMAFTAMDDFEKVPEQILHPFERHGFALIEWGAAEIKR